MNAIAHPAMGPQPAALIRTLGRFDRQTVEAFISVAIELLDVLDGNSDVEEDDPSGQCDEDEINTNLDCTQDGMPGCVISDNDIEHDGCEEERGL